MSASDLALWDLAILQGKLLKPTSQSQLLAEAPLRMYPDDGMALVVLTNGPGPAADFAASLKPLGPLQDLSEAAARSAAA